MICKNTQTNLQLNQGTKRLQTQWAPQRGTYPSRTDYRETERKRGDEAKMPSLLSGTSNNFVFKPDTKLFSNHPTRIKPHELAFSLKSQLQPNSQTPQNKPIWPLILKPKFSRKSANQLHCGISSNDLSTGSKRGLREWIEVISDAISTAFPIWVSLGCLLGLLRPASYNWVTPKWVGIGLPLTMLGMGMTLTLDDLSNAFAMPKEVLSGFVLQYSVMPISGFLVSKLLNLPSHYAAGLILVGCCPGGTASNIVTYIARGNVALSVLMTAASTFASVVMTPFLTAKLAGQYVAVMTPFLTAKLAGQYVAVDATGLLVSTMQVVLLPVLAGAFLNQYFQSLVKIVSPLMPPIAVGTVAVLCGNAIAQSSSAILMSGRQVVLAAFLLHACGFFFGYLLSRMLGLDVASSRTISIEVGMQNSVLGVVLATKHFGNPLTAVPCAVSSVCHSIFGSVLAGIWRRSVPARNDD
ncbi:sodium/metabolite cotransporter BASS1 [Populus alba x Populus x berolinensis]|uniref:Sodium/metabolite cotransporter BASS1 n=1 Tax=Populus alba x Populus x berolinensis TaxID=444605 RepID=A0AAD6Q5I9_9ROSI|nr:sodium/metabolite cotransporter BASS1 [Populus alba x Populus x berolinensis]